MLQITQAELKDYTENGKTMIWQYKTLYQIDYSKGVNEYIIRKITQKSNTNNSIGVTARGRYIPMTPETAQSYL